MDSATPDKHDTEKMYDGIIEMFHVLQNRFIKFEKDNKDDNSTTTLDYLTKLSGSIGYTAQVHAGLAKAYQHEKRLSDIEKKIEKIPPEVLNEYLKSGR